MMDWYRRNNAMSGTLDVGVIGGGAIARTVHLPYYAESKNTRVRAIAEVDADRRQELDEEYPRATTYQDGETLLGETEIDALSICSPPVTHEHLFVEAAKQGIHVFCEKPLATDPESAQRMQAAAEAADIVTQIGYSFRFMRNYDRVLQMVRNYLLGDLTRVQIVYHSPPPTSSWYYDPEVSGGGVVIDRLSHVLDFLMDLAPEELALREVTLKQLKTDRVEDFADVELSFGETTVSLTVSWTHERWYQESIVQGTGGVLEFDQEKLTGNVRGNGVYYKYGQLPTIELGSLYQTWWNASEDYEHERMNDFVTSIRADDRTPKVPIERGVAVTDLIGDIYERGT